LLKLLDGEDLDLSKILRHFEIDKGRLSAELKRSLDRMKSGNARTPSFSPWLVKTLTEAWTIGSIDYGVAQIRSGFTILALASNEELARVMRDVSKEFQKIQAEALRNDFPRIVDGSREEMISAAQSSGTAPGGAPSGSKTPFLSQYTVNLTDNAAKGKVDWSWLTTIGIDPVVGPWSAARLAPAMSLWHGYALYSAPGSGPVTGWIYPPLATLAYLPATLIPDPTSAVLAGRCLSLVYFFAPAAWLLMTDRTDRTRGTGSAGCPAASACGAACPAGDATSPSNSSASTEIG